MVSNFVYKCLHEHHLSAVKYLPKFNFDSGLLTFNGTIYYSIPYTCNLGLVINI